MTLDEDESLKRPRVVLSVDLKDDFSKAIKLLDPFFAGDPTIISKYKGTGLELSNANLIAKFLDFDFDAAISNNKLVIKIIF